MGGLKVRMLGSVTCGLWFIRALAETSPFLPKAP